MKTLEQIREAKVGVVMNPKVVGFQVKDAMGKISHSLKHKNGMHHVHVSGNDAKEEVELEESMTGGMKRNDPKLVKIFDKLKKGSTVKIKHNSSLEAGKDFIEYIVKTKNMVNKGRVEKITLARKDSPTSVKRYLYKRDGEVSFAIGDMSGMITAIKEATSNDAMARAMANFKKRGGKIKKLAPGKAQGYHGREDPGTDTHGMLSRSDTDRVGTRKKARSMGKEETNVDEKSPGLWANIRAKKARGETMRKKGAPGAPTQDAIRSAQGKTEDNNLNPPFDNAVKRSTKPTKDKFGNVIKNRARSLARASARSLSRASDRKDLKDKK